MNQERQVLADVAGHPFITTLITSFSDHDSLYMLVSFFPWTQIHTLWAWALIQTLARLLPRWRSVLVPSQGEAVR